LIIRPGRQKELAMPLPSVFSLRQRTVQNNYGNITMF